MAFAPAAMQYDFWQRYNHRSKYEWRKAVAVGDLLSRVLPDVPLKEESAATKLDKAWRQVVPTAFHVRTRVEMLHRRCLRVVVDSAATRFMLSREIGADSLKCLSEQLGGPVARIDYRVGSILTESVLGSKGAIRRDKTTEIQA